MAVDVSCKKASWFAQRSEAALATEIEAAAGDVVASVVAAEVEIVLTGEIGAALVALESVVGVVVGGVMVVASPGKVDGIAAAVEVRGLVVSSAAAAN